MKRRAHLTTYGAGRARSCVANAMAGREDARTMKAITPALSVSLVLAWQRDRRALARHCAEAIVSRHPPGQQTGGPRRSLGDLLLVNGRCATTHGARLAFTSALVSRECCRGWLCSIVVAVASRDRAVVVAAHRSEWKSGGLSIRVPSLLRSAVHGLASTAVCVRT
jgi:hypothetical protein